MIISQSDLQLIMPNLTPARLIAHHPHLISAMASRSINTTSRIAAYLAQLSVESSELLYMEELASGHAYDSRSDLGNTDPTAIRIAAEHSTTPGPFFRGHGPIQITGYHNHVRMANTLSIDCVNDPLLLTQLRYGHLAAAVFWQDWHNLNSFADRGEFRSITKTINGGTTHLNLRADYWFRALRILGVDQ